MIYTTSFNLILFIFNDIKRISVFNILVSFMESIGWIICFLYCICILLQTEEKAHSEVSMIKLDPSACLLFSAHPCFTFTQLETFTSHGWSGALLLLLLCWPRSSSADVGVCVVPCLCAPQSGWVEGKLNCNLICLFQTHILPCLCMFCCPYRDCWLLLCPCASSHFCILL